MIQFLQPTQQVGLRLSDSGCTPTLTQPFLSQKRYESAGPCLLPQFCQLHACLSSRKDQVGQGYCPDSASSPSLLVRQLLVGCRHYPFEVTQSNHFAPSNHTLGIRIKLSALYFNIHRRHYVETCVDTYAYFQTRCTCSTQPAHHTSLENLTQGNYTQISIFRTGVLGFPEVGFSSPTTPILCLLWLLLYPLQAQGRGHGSIQS